MQWIFWLVKNHGCLFCFVRQSTTALARSLPPEHFTGQNQQITHTTYIHSYSPLLRLWKRVLDGERSLSLDPWAPIVLLFLLPWRQHDTRGFSQFQFTGNYESFLPPHNLPVCIVACPLSFWQFIFVKNDVTYQTEGSTNFHSLVKIKTFTKDL